VDVTLRLVVNPAAGHGRARRVLAQVTAALDAAATAHEVRECASLDRARELAAADRAGARRDGPARLTRARTGGLWPVRP
jgi:diacylglycerol kinase family enzyme